MAIVATLKETLDRHTKIVSELVEPLGNGRVRCLACGHRCPIPPGAVGVCKVRGNREGQLYAPWGYVGGVQCDPVEKKPFFHVVPARWRTASACWAAISIAATARTGSRRKRSATRARSRRLTPRRRNRSSRTPSAHGARLMVSTYNEPLITAEWAVAVFEVARRAGLLTGFVSNGNGTPEVLRFLRPYLDVYKVDLKSFEDRRYRELGGRLAPILDTIQALHASGIWVEIVTLLIDGFNDSDAELAATHVVRRRRVSRHPVARDRVSPRLSHAGSTRHDGRHAGAGRRDWTRSGAAIRLCGESAGTRRLTGRHALHLVRHATRRTRRLPDSVVRDYRSRHLPLVRYGRAWTIRSSLCATAHLAAVPPPGWPPARAGASRHIE